MMSGRHEDRREGGGGYPTKNLKVLLVIYILSKNLRLQCLKDGVNTARYSVDSRLINTRFESYNDQAHPLSLLPDIFLPGLSPLFFTYCKRSKTEGQNGLGTKLGV